MSLCRFVLWIRTANDEAINGSSDLVNQRTLFMRMSQSERVPVESRRCIRDMLGNVQSLKVGNVIGSHRL